jgi:hypothetical protein
LWLLLPHLFLGVLLAAVVGGMWIFSVRQLTVAARRSQRCVPLLRTVFIYVAAPTPQAPGRLLTVSPDVAKLLAVKELGECGFGLVCVYFDGNVAQAGEFEYILRFLSLGG